MKPFEGADLLVMFADEVRQEANLKATVIGWHQNSKARYSLEPAPLIPRLAMICFLRLPRTQIPNKLMCNLQFAGSKFGTYDITAILKDQLADQLPFSPELQTDQRLFFTFEIGLTNHPISGDGTLSVRIEADDQFILSNGLAITSAQTQSS